MYKTYIAQLQHGLMALYHEDSCIYYKMDNEPKALIQNALADFSANIWGCGRLCVTCQDADGDVFQFVYDGGGFTQHCIFKAAPTAAYHSIEEHGIIYNAPIEGERKHMLLYQDINRGAIRRIDFITAGFKLLPVFPPHYLLLYHHEGLRRVGYKELYEGKVSEFVPLFTGSLSQAAFMVDTEGLHMLYTSPGLFGSHLLYKSMTGKQSEPVSITADKGAGDFIVYKSGAGVEVLFKNRGRFYKARPGEAATPHDDTNSQAATEKALFLSKHSQRPTEIFVDTNQNIVYPHFQQHLTNENVDKVSGKFALGSEDDYRQLFEINPMK